MKTRNRVVTMLLAGGQGSRLKALTRKVAKPAVPFGGKYRIIDFALSNSANSEIRDIGILTQYKPFELNTHIGNGSAWDYDRDSGGLRILSPHYTEKGGRWYEGTANAILENIDFLDDLEAEYVLVLSGDHIYKMNYKELLNYHKEKGSVATIAVMPVPWEEASRFGILNTDEENAIVEFDEKPANPKSNLASMGIYMFNWSVLREFLLEDDKDEASEHDFGMNILPKMLNAGNPMYAWKFEGYWKDVGTVKSYWEANLDLLEIDNPLDIFDTSWQIYTKARNLPPHFVSSSARIKNALINEACRIYGDIEHSVLFNNVHVEEGAAVKDSVLLSNSIIREGAKVYNAVIMEDVIVEKDQAIGSPDCDKVYLVSPDGITEEG